MVASSTGRRTGHAKIVVSGDVTIDWNLALQPMTTPGVTPGVTPQDEHSSQRGGAALLGDLVARAVSALPAEIGPVQVDSVEAPQEPVPPGDIRLNHSYALWERVPRTDLKQPGWAWRSRRLLGVDRAATDIAVKAHWENLAEVLPGADVIVLDDAALGFREQSDLELWRDTTARNRPWIVLKQAHDVLSGPLWDHLLATAPDRLIVIVTIDDLRRRDVQVSRDLSWERTAQDLLWELVHKPTVAALSRVAHTVVSFGPVGAALVSAAPGADAAPSCTLFFDPHSVEGSWEARYPGRVIGATDTLVAALVRELALDPDSPDLSHGIQTGTAAARLLQIQGYEVRGTGRMELGFPFGPVLTELASESAPLASVTVNDPSLTDRYWTILEDRCTGDLASKAAEIAVLGAEKALSGVPLGKFGHLVTADRSEIEDFRSIGGLISEYLGGPQSKPLSLGVFGPPGSGKSFGVKEVARTVGEGQVDKPLEFNLSQLRGPDDLIDAFHQVRDRALAGSVPLVFWDEFDAALNGEPLGWLRYFLAPMQDGEFRQGQLSHPLGRCIFVFAGGTSARIEDFIASVDSDRGRLAKGPDFVSRLKGFVNILGPNPQGRTDPFHLIRRAILFRSILARTAPDLFSDGRLQVDAGVLRAFLETREFRHGARSMEAIVSTSRLTGRSAYERSSLPAEPQLNLHVDAQDFLSLVQRPELEGELLERLARAAHQVYCDGLGDRDDLTQEERASLVSYDELADYKKDENLRTVRDIPAKLAAIGCVMVPGRAELPHPVLTEDEVQVLARAEHQRWLTGLGPGWSHGAATDTARKVHVDYLPWEELPTNERKKDEQLVLKIPQILQRAGYALVRTGSDRCP